MNQRNRTGLKKTPCMSAVALYLGVYSEVRYLQFEQDIVKAVRKLYDVKHLMGHYNNNCTINDFLSRLNTPCKTMYIIMVNKHVLLVSSMGKVLVDTDSKDYGCIDNRTIVSIYEVNPSMKSLRQR